MLNLTDIYKRMKDFIKKRLKQALLLKENNEVELNKILDKINKVGFNNLTTLDRIKLASYSGDDKYLKSIDPSKLTYKDIDEFNIRVKVKPIEQQQIDHKLSKEFAGETGVLPPSMHHDENGELYSSIKFDRIVQHSPMDYGHDSSPIMLKNLEIIGVAPKKHTNYDTDSYKPPLNNPFRDENDDSGNQFS